MSLESRYLKKSLAFFVAALKVLSLNILVLHLFYNFVPLEQRDRDVNERGKKI